MMKTDDLIRGLAADSAPRKALWPPVLAAAAAGLAVSIVAFIYWVGMRPDLAQVMTTPRFMLKPIELSLLVVAAAWLAVRLVQPGARTRLPAALAMSVAAIAIAALLAEMIMVPRSEWMIRLAGMHWYVCVTNMALLALPVLAALLVALRLGAPIRPAFAGAAAGLLAGALSASLYIVHCPDDSPLFVAAWFTLAIGIVAAIGAVAGARLLRW